MHGSKRTIAVIETLLAVTSLALPARAQSANYAEIVGNDAVAYEQPSLDSVALRLLYRGEIVVVRERMTVDQRGWVHIALGGERSAYLLASAAGPSTFVPPEVTWKPERALRNERPVAIAALAYGISQGAGLQLRYLPLTRIGLALNAGTILGKQGLEGSSLAFGVSCLFSQGQLTPVAEVGYALLVSDADHSRQRIQALYVSAGLEWMWESGIYLAALATYHRSLRIEVMFEHDDTSFVREHYGRLDATGRSTVQRLSPALLVGYAF